MEKNKHGNHQGSAFFWGLIIGALLATLITTKRGRLVLRELIDLGLELIENFVDERNNKEQEASPKSDTITQEEEIILANEDLKSEDDPEHPKHKVVREISFEDNLEAEAETSNTNGNGHTKKRLFRGIRRR